MARVILILAVAALMLAAHQLGILGRFSQPAQIKHTLVQLGPWGYAAFLTAYALLQPFGVPGTVFVWAAPLVWPWRIAFVLSMTGTMMASVVGFSFVRFVARDWVAEWVPERFTRYDALLERQAFRTVVVLRFIFWMPPLLHAFFGVSRVSFWTHFWGSALGYLLPLLAVSYFGEQLLHWFVQAPLGFWVGLGLAFAGLGAWVWLRAQRATPR